MGKDKVKGTEAAAAQLPAAAVRRFAERAALAAVAMPYVCDTHADLMKAAKGKVGEAAPMPWTDPTKIIEIINGVATVVQTVAACRKQTQQFSPAGIRAAAANHLESLAMDAKDGMPNKVRAFMAKNGVKDMDGQDVIWHACCAAAATSTDAELSGEPVIQGTTPHAPAADVRTAPVPADAPVSPEFKAVATATDDNPHGSSSSSSSADDALDAELAKRDGPTHPDDKG